MVIRLFLALLALLTGITSAQSAVPVALAQSAIGVTSPVEFESANFTTQRSDVRYLGVYSPKTVKRFTREARSVPTTLTGTIAPTTFIGDRQLT